MSLLKDGHRVPLVVSPLYDNIKHKRLENTALSNAIEYIREKNINSSVVVEKVKKLKPDFLITAHFEKLIKKDLLDIPIVGALNLHPSLLPYYRGMSPQHWPIINGEKKTGITVHFLDEGIDTGDIVQQKEIELTDNMYVSDLQLIWTKYYANIISCCISRIYGGGGGVKQNSTEGSYYGKLTTAQCEIQIANGCRKAYNLIRGVSMPYHGAWLSTDDKIVVIWRAEIISEKPQTPVGIITEKSNQLYLSFIDGTLLITKYAIRKKTDLQYGNDIRLSTNKQCE
jgi:methionyl-tRNA formyltransferase